MMLRRFLGIAPRVVAPSPFARLLPSTPIARLLHSRATTLLPTRPPAARLLPSPRPDKASDDPSYATPAKTPAAAKAAAATEGALARGERRKSPLALDPPRAPSPFEPGATPFFHPAHPSRLSRSEVHPPPAPDLL